MTNFRKALKTLKDGILFIEEQFPEINFGNERDIGTAANDIYKQGLIQRFEFTNELARNVIEDFAEDSGIIGLRGSKDAILYGPKVNLMQNSNCGCK